jgi:HPt (histidine-containing phosphotransfer) domain-containing protein
MLIQVSNYHHRWGGLWLAPQLGLHQDFLAQTKADLKRDYLIMGAIGFTAFYSFSLFSRRREDKGSFILGLIAVLLVCRSLGYLGANDPLLSNYTLNFNLTFKFIYVSMIAAPLFFLHFLLDYFPRQAPRRMIWGTTYAVSLVLLFISVADSYEFTRLGIVGQYLGLSLAGFCAVILGRAIAAREKGAKLSTMGCSAVLVGAILDMLSAAGIGHLPANCIGYGLVVFTIAQSQIIAVRFAEAFRKAHHLGQALQLEVERQTREIKTIMQSIELGIFTLVDDVLHVGDQYSKQLVTLIGKDDLQGSTLPDILFTDSRLTEDAKDQTLSALKSSISEDLLNFETNSHCLLREITVQKNDGTARLWELDWTPIVNSQDFVEKILVCVRDVTDIRKLQEKARAQEADLAVMNELISVAEDRFSRFLHTSQDLLYQNQTILNAHAEHPQPGLLRTLFINMHTLKGMARTYQFAALSTAAHEAEQRYASLPNDAIHWPLGAMQADLDRVLQSLNAYERMGREKLSWTLGERILRMSKSQLESVLDDLQSIPLKGLQADIQQKICAAENKLGGECYRPIREIIRDSFKGIDSLARTLNKLPPVLDLDTNDFYLRDTGADLIHSIMTHILRNSLDHGLEGATERLQKGKRPEGRIGLKIAENAGEVHLIFEDDGRGLNLARIEALGRERGLIPYHASCTDEELAELIFQSGVSTAREVTDISGRGVGMDAIRSYLREHEGSIAIHFKGPRQGDYRTFEFLIRIPDRLCWFPQNAEYGKAS